MPKVTFILGLCDSGKLYRNPRGLNRHRVESYALPTFGKNRTAMIGVATNIAIDEGFNNNGGCDGESS